MVPQWVNSKIIAPADRLPQVFSAVTLPTEGITFESFLLHVMTETQAASPHVRPQLSGMCNTVTVMLHIFLTDS